MIEINIFDYNPEPHPSRRGEDRYINVRTGAVSRGAYPWHQETREVRATRAEAYADASAWARDYEAADRMGNMASAMGVVRSGEGWRGLVNYFHSNT